MGRGDCAGIRFTPSFALASGRDRSDRRARAPGHPARALLRPRLRLRFHPGHDGFLEQSDLEWPRARFADPHCALVGLGGLCLVDQHRGILDAIGRSNMIDSPGLIEANHQLVLSLVSGQARTPEEIAQHRRQDHARGRARAHRRRRHGGPLGDAGLHRGDGERASRRCCSNLPPAGQQHGGGRRRGPRRDRAASARTCRKGVELQPFYDQSEIVNDSIKSVRDAILHRPGAGLADHGAVPARLGHVAGRRPGDSGHHRGHVHRAARARTRAST